MTYPEEIQTDQSQVVDESAKTTEPTSGKTFFIPPEYQDDAVASAKPGDVISIRIVGKDADGAVEAEYVKEAVEEAAEDDWQGSLENAMPESMGGKMKEKM